MNTLLIKNTTFGTKKIFPKSYINGIIDQESNKNLIEILSSYNMYFLSYTGNIALTRCKVPKNLRREGLWITYVNFNHKVITEWYNSDKIDDINWGLDTYWRLGSNQLIGDLSISSNGNWVINGEETEFKAIGLQGISPVLRVYENKLQVSTDELKTWKYLSENPITAWFRWASGDTADSVGKIQISRDELKTWTDLSPNIVNNLRIKGYVATVGLLPTSTAALGDIYMVGPTYDEGDETQDYPHYRMWVKLSSGWVDNGEYLSNVLVTLDIIDNTDTGNVPSTNAVRNYIDTNGIVNISTNYNTLEEAKILTLSLAIAKVPARDRVLGFSGKFLTSEGWKFCTFTGESISNWYSLSNWSVHTPSISYVRNVTDPIDPKVSAIKELYINKSNYNSPELPIYLRTIYRNRSNDSGEKIWSILFTRNNHISEYVCSSYYKTNIENEEVIEIKSSNTYGNVYGYIVLDWSVFDTDSTVMDCLVLDAAFDLKNSPGIYNYIKNKSNEDSINTINRNLLTKKTGITYIDEDSIYFNDIIKELYIDKSNYTGENDIYLRLIRKGYLNSDGKQTWVVQFTNGSSTNVVANVYSYDNSVESKVINIVNTSNLYGDVKGYAVIDWDKMDTGANIFVDKKVLESAFNIKNSPTINAFVETDNLSKELSIQQSKINTIKSEPLYIEESEILYNNAIKELYIDKSNYIGKNDLYLRTIYREAENTSGRIRWIIQISNGKTTNIVCTFYQYDAVDESQLITPLKSTGTYGDVTGYIILDWTKFEKNKTILIDKKISDIAFDIKNSPLIKNYIDSLPIDWKEYPTISVFKKGYLPNSGNGFALLYDRSSNINYSVHPKILDKSNNVNIKYPIVISMLEDEAGYITEESVLHLFNLVLKNKEYKRLWIALGANVWYKVGKRTNYDSNYSSVNGHIVTIPDEEVSSLSLESNKAVIFYPIEWHNLLMSDSNYKPYIKIYENNTIQDSEEGLLYIYEIDWRNSNAETLFKNMLNTVALAMENLINGISLKKYISVLEISFINTWGEGSLTNFGTKIPEYENLECLKNIVECYKSSFPDILLAAPALAMSDSSNTYNDNMKDFAVYLATTSGNNASSELGVFMDNVGFYSVEYVTYNLRYNGVYILDAIKNKRLNNKGVYIGELANTVGYWGFELKNDHLPYSIKELGLAMFNHDIRTNDSYIVQTGINYIELMKDCYDKAGYRFYIIGNRSYYTRDKNNIFINIIFWIGNMGYANLYHKFWKPYIIVRTDTEDYVDKILLSNLNLTKINHSDWNIGIDYTTPYRKLNINVDVSSYSENTKFNLYFAIEDSDNISDNMYLSIEGRNNNNEYLIYNPGYTISYNLDGGKNSEFNPTVYYKCRENVILYPPYKEGYVFNGWFKDAEYTEKISYIESSKSIGDISLYAKFSESD